MGSEKEEEEALTVLPTMAVVEPPGIEILTSLRLGGRCGAYRTVTLSNSISAPNLGQLAGGMILPGSSCSISVNSMTRSTDTNSICNVPYLWQSVCVEVTNRLALMSMKAVRPGDRSMESAIAVSAKVEMAEMFSYLHESQFCTDQ